jgi:WD40 repeat protein
LWDVWAGGQGAHTLQHSAPVTALAFSPDSRLLATGSGDSPECHYREAVRHPCELIGGGGDNTARLWDTSTGRQVGPPLAGHTGPIKSVAFSPDGRFLATASADGSVRMWDVVGRRPLGEPLTGHAGQVNSVAFSPDGSMLVTGGADATVRLWQVGLPADPLLPHVCATIGQARLAPQDWAAYAQEDRPFRTPCPGRKAKAVKLAGLR